MHNLAVSCVHRFESSFGPPVHHGLSELTNVCLERFPASLPVAADVDPDAGAAHPRKPTLQHGFGDFLKRHHMTPARTDQQSQGLVGAFKVDLEAVVVCGDGNCRRLDAKRLHQAIQELLHHGLLFGCRCLTCHLHHL